jgi:hypothetical protein
MAPTQIDGGKQIRSGTITTAQLASAAGIVDGQLATSYVKADGTRAFTGEVAGVTPTSTSSLATKGYVDGIAQGLDQKPSARVQTATETLTIASGSVTTIGGTTVDGVTIAVGDYILIMNAPASTGAAGGLGVYTTQPGNGLYKVSAVAANITVARAPEQSGAINPAGDYVFVETGSANNSGFRVSSPSSGAAFTYGTTNMVWTQFSGAGEITVGGGGSLVKTGSQLTRGALTGDVTASADSNATTIAANAVTYAKFQQVAANSVIGNLSGSTANAGAVSAVSAATASTVATRDGNANTRANNLIENFQSITSAAGTTTLTVGSPKVTQITGSSTQTIVLPDATTLVVGQAFTITNRSSGNVTVNANGGGLIQTMVGGSFLTVTCTGIGSAAGTWDAAYTSAGGSGSVTTVSVVSANGFAGSVANASTTPAITISTGITGVLKGNGTAISAASNTAGADYVNASNFITRETPSGTVNGSTTAFTLANTPISGTEQVFLNGLLQEPGAGNDYTISGATITYLTAPLTGDKIRVSYMK